MKIGFFTDSYYPFFDGVATSVEASAKALERRGHSVYIIAPRHPKYKDKNKNVYRLTSIRFLTKESRLALQLPERTLLRVLKIDFDLIHGHSGGAVTLIGLQLAKARNIPYVATYHTLWNRYTHYFLKGRIIRPRMIEASSKVFGNLCDSLIAPTDRVRKELISYGIKKPIVVIPNGINLEKFNNQEKGFLRKKAKIGEDKKILLYAGRLGKEKSIDFIFKAFKLVHKKREDAVLVIVGTGPEKEHLKNLSKTLNINDRVYFLGAIRHVNMPKVYKDSDIFVFSSQTETQGMVVLESLASGLPVVAVKDTVFDGIITSGKNGYTVKKDERIFSSKIIDILSNKKKQESFSKAAVKSAEKFSSDNAAKKLEELYNKFVQEERRKHHRIINIKNLRIFVNKFREQIKLYQ
jgi:1,2-diacylglycerol 3-alpha-glucosyltransferase